MKKLVKRCCGHDDVPTDLRAKVMGRIDLIRSGQAVPEHDVTVAGAELPSVAQESVARRLRTGCAAVVDDAPCSCHPKVRIRGVRAAAHPLDSPA